MSRYRLLLIFGMLFCALHVTAQNQSLDALREEIRKAEAEIKATNALLTKTNKDKKLTQNQLKLIQNRIRNRKQIIANLEKQTEVINGDISTKNDTVTMMQERLALLKKEYGNMVYAAYKNYKLNNFLVFLFASKDFNDATRRISYMRRYNRLRQEKAEQIKSIADSLHIQITELETKKDELNKVHENRTQEITSLGKDEKQYKNSLAQINTKAGKSTNCNSAFRPLLLKRHVKTRNSRNQPLKRSIWPNCPVVLIKIKVSSPIRYVVVLLWIVTVSIHTLHKRGLW